MPVVLTDYTNSTWCTEQLTDGYLHVGYTGHAGPRLVDLLDFARTRQKQFEKFVEKREAEKTNVFNEKRCVRT
jgi:hypothetical protein